MRNRQALSFDYRISKQQDVDINCARTFFLLAMTSHFFLNGENCSQQLFRHLLRAEFHNAIQEPGLSEEFDWLRLVDGRCGNHLAKTSDALDCSFQIGDPVTDVRSQGEESDFIHQRSLLLSERSCQKRVPE